MSLQGNGHAAFAAGLKPPRRLRALVLTIRGCPARTLKPDVLESLAQNNFISEALCNPTDYISYSVSERLGELFKGKAIVESESNLFELEKYVQVPAEVVKLTDGFSFAYLKELFVSAMMEWINSPGPKEMGTVLPERVVRLRGQMSRAKDVGKEKD